MYGRRRKFTKRPIRRMRSRYARKGTKVSKVVKRYVKKVFHRNVENKQITIGNYNQTITSALSSTPAGIPLIPAVSQGITAGLRVGNEIKCVSGIIKGRINLLPYNAVSNYIAGPLIVKLWLFKCLSVTSSQAALSNYGAFNDFFRTTATSTGFANQVIDTLLPVNQDVFKVFQTKTFKIGAAGTSTSSPVGSYFYYDNSPMSIAFQFNWGKYVNKILKFNDNSSNCTNCNINLAIQVVAADGSQQSTNSAEWHYVNMMKFEDA